MVPKILTLAATGLSLAACATQLSAEPGTDAVDLHQALDARAPGWLAEHDVPSMAVAFIEDGAMAWTAVYGEQSPGVPANDQTLYNIASLTKPVVEEAILRLVAQDRIALDEVMADYWVDPDIADNAWTRLLTPEIAMRHRTGFPNWRYQTDDVLGFQWEPGTHTGYSGEGLNYLARFAEVKLGQDLAAIVGETLFAPLSMTATAFTEQPWFAGRVAMVQGEDGSRRMPDMSEAPSAADNLFTTIGDFGRFVAAASRNEGLTPALITERARIEEDEVAEACPEGLIDQSLCPEHAGFGLGWQVFDNGTDRVLLHTGKDWGERTLALFVPERRFGLVILTSGANGSWAISEALTLLYDNPELNAQFLARAQVD